ncbi:hypothetical protein NDU88_006473 [Pleurodeles waltl]|uniref:Uncharacterized protein n=1 Tax=Pleurodeles waltl TaxID=8319 RepID=A0AAV7N7C3_PLEWA|nr:hypothetical protein NDU88_006473 [Pleurodeles waltl]
MAPVPPVARLLLMALSALAAPPHWDRTPVGNREPGGCVPDVVLNSTNSIAEYFTRLCAVIEYSAVVGGVGQEKWGLILAVGGIPLDLDGRIKALFGYRNVSSVGLLQWVCIRESGVRYAPGHR